MKGKLPILIEVTKATRGPTMVFKEPKDMVASTKLTRNQKIEISRRLEYDACKLEVVMVAGMAAPRKCSTALCRRCTCSI